MVESMMVKKGTVQRCYVTFSQNNHVIHCGLQFVICSFDVQVSKFSDQ